MPGLMRSMFDPTRPKPKLTQNITNTAAAPAAPAGAAPTGVAPGTAPEDFTKNQTAYWQQLLAGTGNTQPGNVLPAGVQENIDKQASLLT
jgi:hypothetical protein